jgi:REP element-mobilizing transposase RayT
MILAHHCIFSMYGFWLPNDPRGSGSDYIAVWELFRYGAATKMSTRWSVAHVEHDRVARLAAKQSLRYPPVEITGQQALAAAGGFAQACADADYAIHACAILSDHVHLVIGAHAREIRTIVGHFKSRATRALKEQSLWYADGRPVWGAHGWNVRLEELAGVERAIEYVERNPEKEGKRRQRWSLVTAFELEAARRAALQPMVPKRRVGGAALRSKLEKRARRERRG